ncbi:hypothetical protein CANARDRAFT_5754 [[Candida] arabinofermentans NRRL YB-2248]|uniref:Uncharacterized protein n=1 Tax=[Candida] arabinofermentans NRRL YB-2248 TaxID=983967 RepID=A0A1E4T658_9ASCO|nr:hypothetical protein CANARDRAFT_5754 [[Candida] arabinofermentans NRRL YB-2248]
MSFEDNLLFQDATEKNHIDETPVMEDENEASVVGRALTAIVDIGSNGIRFSISSKAPHHARIMPCVFKDRLGISLFDAQLPDSANTNVKKPIPEDAIREIIQAMKRFKWICEDFGVPPYGVKVVATEATREASNSQEFRDIIFQATGWKVTLLSKEQEGRTGAYGVASSFHDISGLFMDLGGGSTQISWISAKNGEVKISEHPVSLPYGAAALTHRLKFENSLEVYDEIKRSYEVALEKINLPQELIEEAERNGGFRLFCCGGGLRGLGHLMIGNDPTYPIQTIINGYSTTFDRVKKMANYLLLKKEVPKFDSSSKSIFRVSARREQQLPAVGLLVSAAFEALPKIKSVHFSEGGVREGVLYSMIPNEIKIEDPILTATRPYAPLLAYKYGELLKSGLPDSFVPEEVTLRVVPALCNIAFVHCSYPKELQPTAALHVATTGIIAGSHGLSHKIRALIGIACCERWGADIPPSEETYSSNLEKLVLEADPENGESLIYWTKYCGKMMHVICGIHPGGNIRAGSLFFKVKSGDSGLSTGVNSAAATITNGNGVADLTVSGLTSTANNSDDENTPDTTNTKVKGEVYVLLPSDDIKYSYSIRSRIVSLQKKIKKLNRSYNCPGKVKVLVKYDKAKN